MWASKILFIVFPDKAGLVDKITGRASRGSLMRSSARAVSKSLVQNNPAKCRKKIEVKTRAALWWKKALNFAAILPSASQLASSTNWATLMTKSDEVSDMAMAISPKM